MTADLVQVCRACGVEKPLEDFYRVRRVGGRVRRDRRCKTCVRASVKTYEADVRAGRRQVVTHSQRHRNKPLRSRTPLERSTPLPRRRATPRRSDRQRDRAYLLRVKGLPCLLDGTGCCWGSIEADHAGPRPYGRKADDSTAIPLCTQHHRERTDYSGFFAGFTAVEMRVWCDRAIEETRATLEWKECA